MKLWLFCVQIKLKSLSYLWKPLLDGILVGRYSFKGAKYPPYSGIGNGCGWGKSP